MNKVLCLLRLLAPFQQTGYISPERQKEIVDSYAKGNKKLLISLMNEPVPLILVPAQEILKKEELI